MTLTRSQRIRLGLPPDLPPPYEPIPVNLVQQMIKRADREATKIATVSTALIAVIAIPAYLLAGPLFATLTVLALGQPVGWAVMRIWTQRRAERP